MGFTNLERKILGEARKLFKNPKLQNKDIREWSNSKERVVDNCEENEVVAEVPELGVWVCIFKSKDMCIFKSKDKRGARR